MTQNMPQIDAATAMMIAAEYVEQEGRLEYYRTSAKQCPTHGGCPLAWVAYVAGLENDRAAFEWLGYDGLWSFFRAMDGATSTKGGWIRSPTLAATGLRKLAQERMNGNP